MTTREDAVAIMTELRESAAAMQAARTRRVEAIARARELEPPFSWNAIGAALGITDNAAKGLYTRACANGGAAPAFDRRSA